MRYPNTCSDSILVNGEDEPTNLKAFVYSLTSSITLALLPFKFKGQPQPASRQQKILLFKRKKKEGTSYVLQLWRDTARVGILCIIFEVTKKRLVQDSPNLQS